MKAGSIPKFVIENNPIYQEMYYLYVLKRLKEGFYQQRGFVVNPKAKTKSGAEVVFPKIDSVLSSPIINKTLLHFEHLKNFPLRFTTQDYEHLKKWDSFGPVLVGKNAVKQQKKLETLLKTHSKEIVVFLAQIHPNIKNYTFKVIPVNFGTRVSFFENPKTAEILVTWRYDMQNGIAQMLEGLVSQTIILEGKNSDTTMYKDIARWNEREAICDFLTVLLLKRLKLNHELKSFTGTVGALRSKPVNTMHDEKHLAEIGAAATKQHEKQLKIHDRLLHIDDKKVYLTEMESKFMEPVLKSAPYAATFDEIAASMWGEDSDKFSLYALSRTQANIRMKLRSLGHEDLLLTIRGKGVAIKPV